MKDVLYNKSFIRQYTKLPVKIQKKFKERIAVFKKNPHHPLLKPNKFHVKSGCFGVLTSLAIIVPSFYGRVMRPSSTKLAPIVSCIRMLG